MLPALSLIPTKHAATRLCTELLPLCIILVGTPGTAYTQTDSTLDSDEGIRGIRVYLDCDRCDKEYFKTELTYVNYVRDRHDAQVHILITRERTGSGGWRYTHTFIGNNEFAGIDDTLAFSATASEVDESIRNKMLRSLKLGLVRYVSHTPMADDLAITYQGGLKQDRVVDPWDYWVFKSSLRTFFNGEKAFNHLSLSANISANRITPDLKLSISLFGSYNESNFDVEASTISSFSRSKGANASVVFGLSDHWSTGASGTLFSSTFQNIHLSTGGGGGVEYNLFPYQESTRRQLRIAYELSYRYTRYDEITIYDKTFKHLFRNELSATLELVQPWGSVEFRVVGSHYIHDFSKNRLELFDELSLSLLEGLSLDVFASISFIHDQLSLRRANATTEEILLQRRQLETQFNYFGSVGLSYTFGSIYSNIVNPRFGTF